MEMDDRGQKKDADQKMVDPCFHLGFSGLLANLSEGFYGLLAVNCY